MNSAFSKSLMNVPRSSFAALIVGVHEHVGAGLQLVVDARCALEVIGAGAGAADDRAARPAALSRDMVFSTCSTRHRDPGLALGDSRERAGPSLDRPAGPRTSDPVPRRSSWRSRPPARRRRRRSGRRRSRSRPGIRWSCRGAAPPPTGRRHCRDRRRRRACARGRRAAQDGRSCLAIDHLVGDEHVA